MGLSAEPEPDALSTIKTITVRDARNATHELILKPILYFSPAGVDWGTAGIEARNLGLTLLAHVLGNYHVEPIGATHFPEDIREVLSLDVAGPIAFCQEFVQSIICDLPGDGGFVLPARVIHNWLATIGVVQIDGGWFVIRGTLGSELLKPWPSHLLVTTEKPIKLRKGLDSKKTTPDTGDRTS